MKRLGAACIVGAVVALLFWWRPWFSDPDLTRALEGGVGRKPSPAAALRELGWWDLKETSAASDTLLLDPVSMCWTGEELVVADRRRQRIVVFDSTGRPLRTLGRRGLGSGEFLDIAAVRCADHPRRLLVADHRTRRLSFYDHEWQLADTVAAPTAPDFELYLGEFELLPDGGWVDSWMGMTRAQGPYLTPDRWEAARLVRRWSADHRPVGEFGLPDVYENTVSRRVFNRSALVAHRDTLWVLTQGNALVRGFDLSGEPAAEPVPFPIHYRGAEPRITVRDPPLPDAAFRPNKLTYQPNVWDLAIAYDSLFATIRYRNWRVALQGGPGNRSLDYWADSAVELIGRSGDSRAAYDVPGRAVALATDGDRRVAVLVESPRGERRVLLAFLEP